MSVKKLSEIRASELQDGIGVTRKILISPEEAPNFAMRYFSITPGGSMPLHTNQVEHEQYVLSGHRRIGIGEVVYEVQKGEIVYISPEIPHVYINIGNEPFEFLCLVPVKEDSIKFIK